MSTSSDRINSSLFPIAQLQTQAQVRNAASGSEGVSLSLAEKKDRISETSTKPSTGYSRQPITQIAPLVSSEPPSQNQSQHSAELISQRVLLDGCDFPSQASSQRSMELISPPRGVKRKVSRSFHKPDERHDNLTATALSRRRFKSIKPTPSPSLWPLSQKMPHLLTQAVPACYPLTESDDGQQHHATSDLPFPHPPAALDDASFFSKLPSPFSPIPDRSEISISSAPSTNLPCTQQPYQGSLLESYFSEPEDEPKIVSLICKKDPNDADSCAVFPSELPANQLAKPPLHPNDCLSKHPPPRDTSEKDEIESFSLSPSPTSNVESISSCSTLRPSCACHDPIVWTPAATPQADPIEDPATIEALSQALC